MKKYFVVTSLLVVMQVVHGMELVMPEQSNNSRCQNDAEKRFESAKIAISKMGFKGNEGVINIGCGDKRITEEIRKKIPQGFVTDVDFSNMQFIYSFDYAIAFGSLEWCKSHRKALTRTAASLYEGGRIFISMAHEDSAYLRARHKMQTHNKWKQFLSDYEIPYYPSSSRKIQELLRDVGCKVLTLRRGKGTYVCKTRQDCIDLMRNFPIQKDMIPLQQQNDFFNDIIDEYLKEVPLTKDGSIELIMPSIHVVAERNNAWGLVLADAGYY